jgi:hypothetical protein
MVLTSLLGAFVDGKPTPMSAGASQNARRARFIMPAKKRPARAHAPLPAMPLRELPMMKALLALTGGRAASRQPATKGDPKTQLTTLRLTIIDKLQVLALRRPRALVIVAQVLDRLLDEQLEVLDEQLDTSRTTKTKGDAGRTAHHRSAGR